ncbi:ABC transporter ATP-binding protein [Actinocorallia aurea]
MIHVEGLVKSFGDFRALDGLNLSVARGEVHGFLGPNGAGKSTTIRVLLGLLRANAGRVEVLGGDPWKDVVALHRRLAYVPGDVSLWPGMTGGEAIDLLGNLRGGLDETRRRELIERFELDPTKRGRQYSKGNRQKVALVAALASDVDLLILDEPTSGLDPLMEAVFQEEIAREKDRGRSVLLSSHILSEAEALADRISIIRAGKVVETGTLDQLRRHTRTTIHATLAEPPASLDELRFIADARLDGSRFTGSVDPAQINAAMAELSRHRMSALTVAPPSLEDLFLRHYSLETDSAETDSAETDSAETDSAKTGSGAARSGEAGSAGTGSAGTGSVGNGSVETEGGRA